jgi:hypothetical protein
MKKPLVYGAWMHPELKEVGWDTVLKKNQIYNNCELAIGLC